MATVNVMDSDEARRLADAGYAALGLKEMPRNVMPADALQDILAALSRTTVMSNSERVSAVRVTVIPGEATA